jgi:hypothetical protein
MFRFSNKLKKYSKKSYFQRFIDFRTFEMAGCLTKSLVLVEQGWPEILEKMKCSWGIVTSDEEWFHFKSNAVLPRQM